MHKFELYADTVIYANSRLGAVMMDDGLWYPFAFFDTGELDVYEKDGGYYRYKSAFDMADIIFT